jgi:hypothetical protein
VLVVGPVERGIALDPHLSPYVPAEILRGTNHGLQVVAFQLYPVAPVSADSDLSHAPRRVGTPQVGISLLLDFKVRYIVH